MKPVKVFEQYIEEAVETAVNTFKPQVGGTYKVQISNGVCKAFSDCFEYSLAATENMDQEATFNFYPNPFTSEFNIKSSREFDEIEIFDARGVIIYSNRTNVPSDQYVVDLSEFSTGIYIVQLKNTGEILPNSKTRISKQ